jgi:hypothetical protein
MASCEPQASTHGVSYLTKGERQASQSLWLSSLWLRVATKATRRLRNLGSQIDFDQFKLLNSTVIELIITRDREVTRQSHRLCLRTVLDIENDYSHFDEDPRLQIRKDSCRVRNRKADTL